MIWYRFCKGKRKAAWEVNIMYSCAKNIRHTALCTHHLIFFGGVSSSIPKLEHGGEVASVAAAASRKKKRLVGLWKVASECRGSLLRSTIRLLVDGGCNAEAAVKHTGTTSGKLTWGYVLYCFFTLIFRHWFLPDFDLRAWGRPDIKQCSRKSLSVGSMIQEVHIRFVHVNWWKNSEKIFLQSPPNKKSSVLLCWHFFWNQLNYWAFESSKLFRFLFIWAYH